MPLNSKTFAEEQKSDEFHKKAFQSTKPHSERKKVNDAKRETLGLVSGECTVNLKMQSLDPESNMWTCEDLPPPPTKRANYRAMVIDRKLIVAGGKLFHGPVTNIVECLDLQTKEWTNLPPMRKTRSLFGMAELNGDLYVVGGYVDESWLRSVEKYDFRTGEWQELAPMHSAHEWVKVTVLGELLYAVGNDSSPIECFNPADNEWTRLSHKNERSTRYGIAGVGGYLYAVGGFHKGKSSKTVERFHPFTNTWTVISPGLELELNDWSCVSLNNRLLACTECDNQGLYQISVVESNPEQNEWKKLAPLVDFCLLFWCISLFTFTK